MKLSTTELALMTVIFIVYNGGITFHLGDRPPGAIAAPSSVSVTPAPSPPPTTGGDDAAAR